MHNNDKYQDLVHELWMIYCQLKDAEMDPAASQQLVSSARGRLGQIVNAFNKLGASPKSPCNQADNLNCRCRRKSLTPDNLVTATTFGGAEIRLSSGCVVEFPYGCTFNL